MASLLVRVPGSAARRVVLGMGRLRIGRAQECEIVVEDPGVSRVHAVLLAEGADWIIEDLDSRNGTFVNDSPVRRTRLRPGDRVRLGRDVELGLEADAAAERPRPAGRGRGGTPRRAAASRAGRPSGRTGLPGWLGRTDYELRPREAGVASRAWRVAGRMTTVGREAGAQIQLDHESISRTHARLDREGASLFVTDLKSRNGTRVNGQPALRTPVEPGDVVQFGDLAFEVSRHEGLATARLAGLLGALVALVVLVPAVGWMGDWLNERQTARELEQRLRDQAVASVRKGIAAARQGEADFARGYLLYAADVLLLSDLAPPGASLERPAELFRAVAASLPPEERDFDFARALDARVVEQSRERLARLSNREYVQHQVRRIAIELGQAEEVPAGFVDSVWSFVSDCSAQPGWFQGILDRSPRYHPMLRRLLAEAHLPEAFCYVAWIESRLDPQATSPVGARGLWQFMPGTARLFGLRVDGAAGVDERTDPEKSTRAATRYIGNLIRTFGREQFMCALASYNRGEGGVRRAMEKIPDPMMESAQKFWYLVRNGLLPSETSWYVPRIVAARIMAEDPERFGFRPPGGTG